MAAVIQKAQNTAASTAALGATFTNPVGSGNAVTGIVSWGTVNNNVVSITDDKSNTYTQLDFTTDNTNGQSACTFYLGNITNGPTTVTVNFSGTLAAVTLAIDECSGIAALANPTDGHIANFQATPGVGANAIVSTNITTTVNGDLIWGGYAGTGGQTVGTQGTGFTISNSVTNSGGTVAPLVTEWEVQATLGSVQTTFTNGAVGSTICFIIALKAGGVAANTFVGHMRMQDGPPRKRVIGPDLQPLNRNIGGTTRAVTPTAVLQTMPDLSVRTRPRQWINFDTFPQIYPTFAKTPSTEIFSMPDVLIKTRPRQWINFDALPIYGPLPRTPSTAVPSMPDMPVKTKVQHWTDLVFPLQAQPIVFYGAPALPARSWGNRNRSLPDMPLATTPPPAVVTTPNVFALPDVSIATKKRHWIDFALPLVQVSQLPALPMLDMVQKTKVKHWVDFPLPLAPSVNATPLTFDMRWFDMPMPQRSGRQTLLEQLLGIPPTGACSLLQEDGASRIILEDGSGFLLLENCTPLITSFFDNRWLDMPVPKRQQWLDLLLPLPIVQVQPAQTPARVLQMMPDMSIPSHKQKWLDLLLPGLFVTTTPASTPSNWFFPIPDRSVKTKARQWIDIPPLQEPPTISLGAPALVDMSIPSKKQQWLDLSIGLFPTTQVVTTPPVILAMPDVSIKTRQRQWLDLFLPIYGPLPPTPSTAAFSMLDMAVKTRQRQWLDYPFAIFTAQATQTPSTALMAMLEMLPPKASRRQQWLDLPAVLFYPTLPRTPSSFFDYRWLDMPRPRHFVTEATQGLIGLQTTVPPPVPPTPQLVPPRFRRDPWDRDEWGRFKPGSGFHGV